MNIGNNVIMKFRVLLTIFVLSLALISCGGSDSSTEDSSEESAETTSSEATEDATAGSDSADSSSEDGSSSGSDDSDTSGGDSGESSYMFANETNVVSDSCEFDVVYPIYQRSPLGVVGTFVITPSGRARLNIGGSTSDGDISCSANSGSSLSAGGVRLRYEVSDFVVTLTLN